MRWWTSDTHYSHANIITYCERPFTDPVAGGEEDRLVTPNIEKMNEALIERWNDTVADDDEIIVVGDLAMGSTRHSIPLTERLRGRRFLVPGNHDKCHGMYKSSAKARRWYEAAGWTILPNEMTVTIDGREVLVCHFPYVSGTGTGRSGTRHFDDRYSAFRPDDNGLWLIHGHTHAVEKINREHRMIHVGVDAWDYTPVSDDQLAALINSKTMATSHC
jgi:calcineurin-like phosphoesterase family protein